MDEINYYHTPNYRSYGSIGRLYNEYLARCENEGVEPDDYETFESNYRDINHEY